MNITVLSGGVGGAKFLQGVEEFVAHEKRVSGADIRVSAIVNTADDFWLSGLRVCPDLDSVMYELAQVNDTERGWGRADESYRVQTELTAYGAGWDWFTLGDLDIATHIARTGWLQAGESLTAVTHRLAQRWQISTALLPMTDAEVETRVLIEGDRESLHLEEWWVKHRAQIPASGFFYEGAATARASDEALRAITHADVVLVAPSNPVVSIRPILAIADIKTALRETSARVVGVSPIIGDAPIRGMAKQCLDAVDAHCSAAGVASYLGARESGGLLDAWLIATEDHDARDAVVEQGIDCLSTNLWMRDPKTTAHIVREALTLA